MAPSLITQQLRNPNTPPDFNLPPHLPQPPIFTFEQHRSQPQILSNDLKLLDVITTVLRDWNPRTLGALFKIYESFE